MERAPSENYKPDKTGEFRSRAFVESISPTTILPFLQQEIETFITPRIRDHLDSNSLVGKILRDLRLDENYKWNRRWIIKSPETREEIGTISLFPSGDGKEKSGRWNERSPFVASLFRSSNESSARDTRIERVHSMFRSRLKSAWRTKNKREREIKRKRKINSHLWQNAVGKLEDLSNRTI